MARRVDRYRVRDIFNEMGYEPIKQCVEIARDSSTPVDLKLECIKMMLGYAYPKLAEVDLNVQNETPPTINVNFNALLADPKMRRALEEVQIRQAELARQGKLGTPVLIEAEPVEEK